MPSFEEEYFEQLRSIELAITNYYRAHRDLVDFQVDKILQGLLRAYQAQQQGKSAPNLRLKSNEEALYAAIRQVIELQLGHDPDLPVQEERITLDEAIACLKRIRRSVSQMGDKGRQGYLNFVDQFFADQ